MSQSLTSADAPNQGGSYSLMSRSDTYPELRTESTKENDGTGAAVSLNEGEGPPTSGKIHIPKFKHVFIIVDLWN
jgi:hypothetical protein